MRNSPAVITPASDPLLRKAQVLALVRQVVDACCQQVGFTPPGLFLFGSQAGLSALKPADLDIGLDAGTPLPLQLVMNILTELNQSDQTLYTFDVVDFQRVGPDFKAAALRNLEPIT